MVYNICLDGLTGCCCTNSSCLYVRLMVVILILSHIGADCSGDGAVEAILPVWDD